MKSPKDWVHRSIWFSVQKKFVHIWNGMSDADPEVGPEVANGEVEEEACVEVKVEKKRREHGLHREEQQNVVVQPLLTGKF